MMTSRASRVMEAQQRVRRMTFAALYLALAMVLPFLTGQIPEIGSMLCPMHIPTLLCGFICGWPWGATVGFVSPLLRSVIFGMPTMFPGAVSMAFEMAVYGGLAGILQKVLPTFRGKLYAVLVISMISGRLVWGLVRLLLAGLTNAAFSMEMFFAGAVTSAVPGIILQLVIIPPLVTVMEKTGLTAMSVK